MRGKTAAILKVTVSVLLFYLLFRKVDFRQFFSALLHARIGVLLLSFLVLWLGHLICVFRWRILMRPLMPVGTLPRLFEIYCIGLFFNLTFPTAVGGDLVKMYYAGKQSRLYAQSFAATFLDRDSGMLGMMILAAVGTILLPVRIQGIPLSLIVWPSFAAFVALNVAIFTPALHRMLTKLLRRVCLAGVAVKVDAISEAFQIMGRHPRVLFDSLLISVANQFLVFATTWITAIGLRIDVPFLYFVVFVPVITLVSMIPISLNGTGLREYAFFSLFSAIGLAPESCLALGLVTSLTILLSAVPGGIAYMFFQDRAELQRIATLESNLT